MARGKSPTLGSGTKFPGRKELPSMREHLRGGKLALPESTYKWVEDRAARDQRDADCPKELWLVHGKLYDLKDYMDKHPGGREWLEFSRGTDCTVEFETHHLDEEKVNKILAKYYVRDSKSTANILAYTFEKDGFYKTLKRKVFAKMKEDGKGWGPTPAMKLISALSIVMWMAAFIYACTAQTIASAMLAGLLINPLWAVGHNFFHQRNTWWRYAWDVTCFSHHQWRISHAISHHHFPNTDIDIESSFVEPFLRFFRNQPPNFPGVLLIWFIFNILIAPLEYVRRVLDLVKGIDSWRVEYFIPVAQLGLLVLGAGLGRGVLLFVVMHWVANTLLVVISTPVHRTEYAWTAGCEDVQPEVADYGVTTVMNTNDFDADSAGLLAKVFLYASFNDHITHHLFPTMDLSRQYLVRPIFLECCQQFHVPYHKTQYWKMLVSLFRVLLREPGQLLYQPG